jgi:5-methylcytosine-specific restriction protein A
MKFYNELINIDKELWNKIIINEEIINKKVLDILLCLLNCEKCEASGSEIARKLQYNHYAPLNKIIPEFSKRILGKYPEIIPPKRKNGTIRYWHIPFLGTETKGRFTWILRNELKEALAISASEQNFYIKWPEDYIEEIFYEGKRKKFITNIYERNPNAREECLKHYGYKCQICDFDFGKSYGAIGEGIIHVHHVNKISETDDEHEIDPIKELIPVCPNCHTVIHSRKEMFTINEMKEIIDRRKRENFV